MDAPTPVLETTSPNGNVHAIVEEAGGAVHFYLFGSQGSSYRVKSCWVRNLVPAPEDLDVEVMKAGHAPLLPRAYCAHPNGAPRPDPSDLEVVWFEEGDAAALLERGEILAIVPVWSGEKRFAGYARDCTDTHSLCWPLGTPQTNVLFDRVARAREYWASWDVDPWPDLQRGYLDAVEAVFGASPTYFAIDGGNWPPKALVRYRSPERITLLTLGMSLRPQPTVELYAQDPSPLRRVELGLAIDASLVRDDARQLASYLSAQSGLPWDTHTWLGPGHTLGCDLIPAGPSGTQFSALLFQTSPPGAPAIAFAPYRGDPINVLWGIPVTTAERTLAQQEGSKALVPRLAAAGHGWTHRDRRSVV